MHFNMSNTTEGTQTIQLNNNNMQVATVVFACFGSLHLLGLVLLIANSIFLRFSRGQGSARIGERMLDLDLKRCCKMRNVVACNILIVYHIILMGMEIIVAIVSYCPLISNSTLASRLWILVALSYAFTLFFPCPFLQWRV